jgi:hypothetical protein
MREPTPPSISKRFLSVAGTRRRRLILTAAISSILSITALSIALFTGTENAVDGLRDRSGVDGASAQEIGSAATGLDDTTNFVDGGEPFSGESTLGQVASTLGSGTSSTSLVELVRGDSSGAGEARLLDLVADHDAALLCAEELETIVGDEDLDSGVRSIALWALAGTGEVALASRVLGRASNPDELRLTAIEVLRRDGRSEARRGLEHAFRSGRDSDTIRESALRSLALLGGGSPISYLAEGLSDASESLRIAALEQLAGDPSPESLELVRVHAPTRGGEREVLARARTLALHETVDPTSVRAELDLLARENALSPESATELAYLIDHGVILGHDDSRCAQNH